MKRAIANKGFTLIGPSSVTDRIKVNKGFTLIELLVVISIIAFLSSVVAATLTSARKKARDSNRIQNAKQISTALELYEQSNNTYKIQSAGLDSNPGTGYVAKGNETAGYTNSVLSALKQSGFYNSSTLKDPIYGTDNYYLGLCTSTNAYNVFLKVEQTDLQQSSSTIIQACDGITANSLGFNYVSSTVGGNSGGLAEAVSGGGGGGGGGSPFGTFNAALLVVAGGGGGGGALAGGGGGGGGVIYNAASVIDAAETYNVVVGLGGAGGLNTTSATNGQNSSFGATTSLIAIGGGAGGGSGDWAAGRSGLAGGSGGGGSGDYYVASVEYGGLGTAGQGNNGANGITFVNNSYFGSGGGGAGGIGLIASSAAAGNGGAGLQYSISGSSQYYGAGGGGGVYKQASWVVATNGVGGSGVGGNGTNHTLMSTNPWTIALISATPGLNGTGSGGGGGGEKTGDANGSNGGSGIVIVRYPTATASCTGGTITTDGSDTINTFTSNGTLTCLKY